MADTQEIVQQIIKFSVDNTSQQAAKAALAQLQAGYKRMQAEVASANKELDKTKEKLKGLKGEEFDKASLKAVRLEEKIAKLNKSLGDTATQYKNAAAAADTVNSPRDKLLNVRQNLQGLQGITLPGGIQGEKVGNIIRLVAELDNLKAVAKDLPDTIKAVTSSIGKSGVGLISVLGGLAIVFSILQQRTEEYRKAAAADITAREEAIFLLTKGTKEEQQARINALASQRQANQVQLDLAKNLLDGVRAAIVEQSGGGIQGLQRLGQEELLNKIGQGNAELLAATQAVTKWQEAVSGTAVELDLLTNTTGLTIQTTEELAAAEEALTRARAAAAYLIETIQNDTNNELEKRRLLESGTSEQLKDRLDDLRFEADLYREQAAELRVLQGLQEEGTAAFEDYKNAAEGFEAKARQAEDALTDLGDASLETGIKTREATEYAKQQREDTATAVKKYNDDVTKSEEQTAERRAAIATKLNDTLVKIAENATDVAEKTLDRLKAKRKELTRDAGRAELEVARKANFQQLEDQIKFQENEVKVKRAHEKTLKDIRDSAAADTEEAAFQRDFARLFEIERNKTRQMNKANEEATAQGQERLEAFHQQQADAQRVREFEHSERMLRLEEARADSQAAFEEEQKQNEANRVKAINAAQVAANTELRMLNTKHNQELSARARAITEELKLINLGANARIKAEADIQNALIAQARRLLSALSTPASVGGRYAPTTRAFGGSLQAGQASFVNDGFKGQRESFAGSQFPSGLGLFIPSKSGTVTPQGGAGGAGKVINLSITQNIKGNNDEQIARISAKMINETLQDLVA